MRSNFWKDFALFCVAFLAIFLIGVWAGQCRGDEVHTSPQSSSTWKAPMPPRASDAFSTPPSDGPNPPEVHDPGTAPPTPTPNPAPAPDPTPKVPGKSRLTTTAESEGGLIINSNSGVIYLHSPGAQPSMQQAAMPAPTLAAYPLIPGPLTDQQYLSLAKRIGGGLSYMVTGQCPNKAQAPAPASPQMFAMVPTATPVPVQMVHVQVPMQAPAPPPMAAPIYLAAPQSPVYAAPQYAVQPEPAKKKCWLFGGK